MKGKQSSDVEVKKQLKAELRLLEEKIFLESKTLIKVNFNYSIPIAEVEKAGISSTGSKIENELEPLAEEFKSYRRQNQLWSNKFKKVKYEILEDDKIYRIPITNDSNIVSEPEIFYGKN